MTGTVDPGFNIDDVHRDVLNELLRERGLDAVTAEDRANAWRRWHRLDCWPDFPAGFMRLKSRYVCVSLALVHGYAGN
jgi:2-haloacid dehalogenase